MAVFVEVLMMLTLTVAVPPGSGSDSGSAAVTRLRDATAGVMSRRRGASAIGEALASGAREGAALGSAARDGAEEGDGSNSADAAGMADEAGESDGARLGSGVSSTGSALGSRSGSAAGFGVVSAPGWRSGSAVGFGLASTSGWRSDSGVRLGSGVGAGVGSGVGDGVGSGAPIDSAPPAWPWAGACDGTSSTCARTMAGAAIDVARMAACRSASMRTDEERDTGDDTVWDPLGWHDRTSDMRAGVTVTPCHRGRVPGEHRHPHHCHGCRSQPRTRHGRHRPGSLA